jgi:hypothetical integral membrane protein (TIGR02206 family)
MITGFRLFGPAHLAIIAAVPVAGAALARICRRRPRAARVTVAAALGLNEAAWWTWRFSREGNRFPEGMPLQLCDFTIWLTIFTLFRLNRWAYDLAYFAGIAGAGMAVLTPELWAPLCSYPSMYFFAAHGGVVAAVLMLTWSGTARPGRGSLLRAFLGLNVYAAAVGIFNAVFGTNYMYLCRKPASATLLDALGPWPYYILAGEAVALALFGLMYLPYRRATPQVS